MTDPRHPSVVLAWLVTLALGAPALAVQGTVKDAQGKPVEGVKICYFDPELRAELTCVGTDARGAFEVPDSDSRQLRISAPGYFPEQVDATGRHEVVLRMSPTLVVRLVDASSGDPLDSGEVFVVYPSSERKGPFPVNRNGVKIARILPVGKVELVGRAAGYREARTTGVTLEPGKQHDAVLELEPTPR